MDIDLRIERLVLEGVDVPRGQRPLLQAAVEAELGRLLAEGGLGAGLMAGGAAARVAGGEVQLTGAGDTVQLGGRIARAVYGGLGE